MSVIIQDSIYQSGFIISFEVVLFQIGDIFVRCNSTYFISRIEKRTRVQLLGPATKLWVVKLLTYIRRNMETEAIHVENFKLKQNLSSITALVVTES